MVAVSCHSFLGNISEDNGHQTENKGFGQLERKVDVPLYDSYALIRLNGVERECCELIMYDVDCR
jgi:hypothetical protein